MYLPGSLKEVSAAHSFSFIWKCSNHTILVGDVCLPKEGFHDCLPHFAFILLYLPGCHQTNELVTTAKEGIV